MYIPIEVSAKNFQSFELLNHKFFQSKSTLIQGENLSDDGQESNGSGKSTLAEVVYYCLIGSSSTGKRDFKLIRRGEKESNISLTLFNSIDKSTLIIERSLFLKKSSTLTIYINEINQSDKFATINDGNDFLLRLIGISSEDLKNFFLVNREKFKPFFKLSDTDSRELISRFSKLSFNDKITEILNKEIEEIETIIEQYNTDKEDVQKVIDSNDAKIEALREQLKNIKENNSKEKVEEAKKKAIEDIQIAINEIELKIKALSESNDLIDRSIQVQKQLKLDCENNRNLLSRCIKRLNDLDYRRLSNDIAQKISEIDLEIKKEVNKKKPIEKEITDFNKEKAALEIILSGKISCPKCSHEFIPTSMVSIKDANELINEINLTIENLEQKLKSIDVIISTKETLKNIDEMQLSKVNQKLTKQRNLIAKYETQLRTLVLSVFDNKISTLSNDRLNNTTLINKHRLDIDTKNNEIESIKESKNDNTLVIKSINESIKLNEAQKHESSVLLKEVEALLENENETLESKRSWLLNFKQFYVYLTNQSLKNIQDLCNKFLEQIDTNLRVQIEGFKYLSDGSIKEKITTVILRDDVEEDDYRSFSGGERGKLTLATILAFQELINNDCKNGGLDLLFIDEILDAVDGMGMKSFIDALNATKKTIYLTTHISVKDKEENVLLIRKINNKSYIVN